MQEADMSITQMAMEGGSGRFQGDEFLMVKFFTDALQNAEKSKAEGRPIFEDQEFVSIRAPGNKDSEIVRVATEMDKQRFPEHYRKFKAREDQDHLEGTLLEEWAGIRRSQVEELKFLNVRTVEQLANIADSNAQNVMGISMLKAAAQKYLETSKDNAAADALAEMKAINEQLQAQLAELQQKPKRKRRTKAEIEAEKAINVEV